MPIAADLKLMVAPLDGSAEVVSWWTAVAARLEAVGLPLEGEGAETWGARLKIGKKGGGEHFDESRAATPMAASGLRVRAALVAAPREGGAAQPNRGGAGGAEGDVQARVSSDSPPCSRSYPPRRVADGRAAAERSFTAAGLPATLGDSVAAVAPPARCGRARARRRLRFMARRGLRRQEAIQDDALPRPPPRRRRPRDRVESAARRRRPHGG